MMSHAIKFINPSYLVKSALLNPFNASVCCGVFIVVDEFAKFFFAKLSQEFSQQPLVKMARITLSSFCSAIITNAILAESALAFTVAFSLVSITIVAFVALNKALDHFDEIKLVSLQERLLSRRYQQG